MSFDINTLLGSGLFGLGTPELIVIAVIVLLLFGSTRIRPLMRSLGGGIKDFKKGMAEGMEEDEEGEDAASNNNSNARLKNESVSDAVIEGERKKQKA